MKHPSPIAAHKNGHPGPRLIALASQLMHAGVGGPSDKLAWLCPCRMLSVPDETKGFAMAMPEGH